MKLYGTVSFVSSSTDVIPNARRTHYLDIALRLFLQHGFNGVSMDQLVAEAGGSKATLYRYFPSKEALFEAIIDEVAAPAVNDEGEDWEVVGLEPGLLDIGRATAAAALDPRTILLLRLAIGEHARFPHLATTLFEHGAARTYARLRGFLATRRAAGDIDVDDLQIAAEQFLGGIIGHQQLRAALGLPPPTRKDIEARVQAAVRTFIAAYASPS